MQVDIDRYADEPAQGCPTATWPTALTNAVTSGCRLPSNARRSGWYWFATKNG